MVSTISRFTFGAAAGVTTAAFAGRRAAGLRGVVEVDLAAAARVEGVRVDFVVEVRAAGVRVVGVVFPGADGAGFEPVGSVDSACVASFVAVRVARGFAARGGRATEGASGSDSTLPPYQSHPAPIDDYHE
jgi:hypothetical protein